ncbi:cadmium resistance transporter [Nostoc sp. 'Lobaria pulmonaria (5183) cyanobiont']|uniref:cadmium resistance transporter n=1 Tax=Nostoc sp. 'Lobaria pulmonaria (5183) cyanobiont' TaxID=1618022 RepID=UPI000CF31386|nr:cadmium resistance transporter [Nostoc sp. 'Lobaria pulmonaria (5183) cyanobiont']AVH73725.1 cadmium resistance transporter [Nostoc sp. 'Lobaria pulmonaria (5183) cyanobiont']
MNDLVTAITTGITAFTATNIDDIVILTLLFSQISTTFRSRHIFAGQYLGFAALIVASLPGFLGGLIIPQDWIRLLGFMPIIIGMSSLLKREENSSEEAKEETEPSCPSIVSSFLSPQTCNVAAIAFANGSDNISVYVPLFANSELDSLLVILSVFFTLVGVWCYTAYKLTYLPAIANFLTENGKTFVPCILIGLGVFIVTENVTWTLLSVISSYIFSLILGFNTQPLSEEQEKLIV